MNDVIPNTFNKNRDNKINFVEITKKEDGFYYTVYGLCILTPNYNGYDQIGDYSTQARIQPPSSNHSILPYKSKKISSDLSSVNAKCYIYLTVNARRLEFDTRSYLQPKDFDVIDSPIILPFADYSFEREDKIRALLAVIGFNGRTCICGPFDPIILHGEGCETIYRSPSDYSLSYINMPALTPTYHSLSYQPLIIRYGFINGIPKGYFSIFSPYTNFKL